MHKKNILSLSTQFHHSPQTSYTALIHIHIAPMHECRLSCIYTSHMRKHKALNKELYMSVLKSFRLIHTLYLHVYNVTLFSTCEHAANKN